MIDLVKRNDLLNYFICLLLYVFISFVRWVIDDTAGFWPSDNGTIELVIHQIRIGTEDSMSNPLRFDTIRIRRIRIRATYVRSSLGETNPMFVRTQICEVRQHFRFEIRTKFEYFKR